MATIVEGLRQAQPEGETLIEFAFLDWLVQQEGERQAKYTGFRDYYDGEQLTQLTARMRKFLELRDDQEFNLNMCPIVVDALAEKLKVANFGCEDEKQQDLFTEWWAHSRMDGQQGITHLAGVRDGDTYVMVEWDNENARPRFTHENAYDGTAGTHVVYSDEHRMIPRMAMKRWIITGGIDAKTIRTNLYYPDRIEKYTDNAGGDLWQQFYDDEAPEEWPRPWVDKAGQPLGIPLVHFRNKDQGKSYGKSELEDVLPQQNALNKSIIDLLAAGDTTAFQIPWMTGAKPSNTTYAPGSWVYSENPNASIGVLSGAQLDNLITLKDSIAADIAKITRTPLSFFQLTGQVSSEGSQKEGRAGLSAKARDRMVTFGNAWEDVQHMARKLSNAFGNTALDLTKTITTVWEDDEKPDDTELATQVELLNRAGAASTKTKVTILHPEWTPKEVDEEVALIMAESGMAVPDLGSPPPVE